MTDRSRSISDEATTGGNPGVALRVTRPSLLACAAGVLACLVVVLATWQFDRAATSQYQAQVHADLAHSLAAVRAAAERTINRHVFLTLGLRSHISVHPEMNAEEFANLAALIMRDGEGIRSVTSIKGNVINDVYPREGNEDALGLNVLDHPEQRSAAEHAIATKQPWLAGPVKLVQGGEAFINRVPVFTTEEGGAPGEGSYWGMVSILIDKDTLVEEISESVPHGLTIAIRGRDNQGRGEIFLGDTEIELRDPLVSEISLPTGTWELYGVPDRGWPRSDPQSIARRIGGSILAIVFGLLVSCLVDATLRFRATSIEARRANERERLAYETAQNSAAQAKKRAAELEDAQLAALNIMEDIEAAHGELSKVNGALKQSNEELQQFAYVASHDLKTPLRAISGFAQFLKDDFEGKLDETADEYIQRIVEGVNRMQQLINDLLEFSRIDSQGRPLKPIDLGEVLDDVHDLLRADIESSGAILTSDPLPRVMADRPQLTQLLQNLIGNAVKYHGERPPLVHVTADEQAGEWTISVRDNGIGIAPKHHERIFEIFKRLHTQKDYEGTGIGLAVCRRIVQRHNGRIWLESALGEGCTFCFTLEAEPPCGDITKVDSSAATEHSLAEMTAI